MLLSLPKGLTGNTVAAVLVAGLVACGPTDQAVSGSADSSGAAEDVAVSDISYAGVDQAGDGPVGQDLGDSDLSADQTGKDSDATAGVVDGGADVLVLKGDAASETTADVPTGPKGWVPVVAADDDELLPARLRLVSHRIFIKPKCPVFFADEVIRNTLHRVQTELRFAFDSPNTPFQEVLDLPDSESWAVPGPQGCAFECPIGTCAPLLSGHYIGMTTLANSHLLTLERTYPDDENPGMTFILKEITPKIGANDAVVASSVIPLPEGLTPATVDPTDPEAWGLHASWSESDQAFFVQSRAFGPWTLLRIDGKGTASWRTWQFDAAPLAGLVTATDAGAVWPLATHLSERLVTLGNQLLELNEWQPAPLSSVNPWPAPEAWQMVRTWALTSRPIQGGKVTVIYQGRRPLALDDWQGSPTEQADLGGLNKPPPQHIAGCGAQGGGPDLVAIWQLSGVVVRNANTGKVIAGRTRSVLPAQGYPEEHICTREPDGISCAVVVMANPDVAYPQYPWPSPAPGTPTNLWVTRWAVEQVSPP